MLIEAQMHMECMNEAFCELFGDKPVTPERQLVVKSELCTRVWAAIYLVQAANNPSQKHPNRFDEVLREANAYNGPMEDDAGIADLH